MKPATARIAIVTGAARGIGAAIAEALAADGCKLWLLDRDAAAVQQAAYALASRHARAAEAIVADVRDGPALAAAAERIRAQDGRLDILVNNAGTMTTGNHAQTDAAQWQTMLDTNLGGIYHCVIQLAPLMTNGGSIVNIASVSSERGGGAVGNVWYGATKAGVVALTKGLARELGPRGVRVNAVSPGVVDTALTHAALTPEIRQRSLARFPLGRLTEAEDIASVVAFLCSPSAAFVTGAIVAVDGGFLTT